MTRKSNCERQLLSALLRIEDEAIHGLGVSDPLKEIADLLAQHKYTGKLVKALRSASAAVKNQYQQMPLPLNEGGQS